ncbi:MAG TPA: acyl-ACP--UDP-N-acetylglucosamine O-acyltransferase [Woeseiaceae bacterium]
MSGGIHATAVVSAGAVIEDGVSIGPYAVIESDVYVGSGTRIGAHAVIRGHARIGRDNDIDAHAVIGGKPQHTRYDGSPTFVVIGDANLIREGVTIHRAFEPGGSTRIGSGCFLMAYAHVGHDCRVGDRVTLSNNVLLGGHVEVGDGVVMGGAAAAHQFIRIGAYCMVAGYVPLRKDVLPFALLGGEPPRHYRLNTVGLRRNGFDRERIRALQAAFRALRAGDRGLAGIPDTADLSYLREWLASRSACGHYGFAEPRVRRPAP